MCSPGVDLMGIKRLKQSAAVLERSRLREDQVPIYRDAIRPHLEREVEALRGALRGAFGTRQEADLDAWIEEFYPEQQQRIEDDLAPVVREYGSETVALTLEEIGTDEGPGAVDVFAAQYTMGLAKRWTSDSVGQLRQILRDEDEVEEAIAQRVAQWGEGRAQRSAEAEATQGAGAFAKHAMVVAGVSRMVWRAVGESCPLCTRMDGRTVEITVPFLSPGDEVEAEGEGGPLTMRTQRTIGHPPLHGHGKRGGVCDCVVSPVLL